MDSSPFGKFIRRFWIPLIVSAFVLVALVVYSFLNSPISPTHMCTLMGCFNGLEITLMPEPPQQYTVRLTTSTGETRSVTCTPGKYEAHFPGSASTPYICGEGQVTFIEFTPQEVTIDIAWQGGSFSTSSDPTYESFKPNGPGCDPECRTGKIQVELP